MIRIVVKTLTFHGEDTQILKINWERTPLLHKVSKFVCLDLSPKDDQNRGEDTKISNKKLGENPPPPLPSSKQPITIQYI